jgi:hypothetical protein
MIVIKTKGQPLVIGFFMNSERVSKKLYKIAHRINATVGGPINLITDGEFQIYEIDIRYEFLFIEKKMEDEKIKFELKFLIGSDLEERKVLGFVDVDLKKLELEKYEYRGSDLSKTGAPGYIQGDPELNRVGLLPNVIVKCFKDAMSKVGISTLRGINISDDAFHP